MAEITVRVQREPFDINAEVDSVTRAGPEVGAVVTFTGVCRGERGRLEALELEHYPGMAEDEIRRIAKDASSRWSLDAATIVHRYGRLNAGDNIVLVVTASEHRHAAFEAASYLMDFMKNRAPFWKKEHLAGSREGDWVAPRDADDSATERWR